MIKKNITINFCGRLFQIDEDAYELLNHYTETIRRYYKKVEGGEEIADDIEERIAELLEEEKSKGVQAVTISMVDNIIKRIGDLDQIAPEANCDNSGNQSQKDNDREQSASDKLRDGASAFAEGVTDTAKNAWQTLQSGKRFYRDGQNKLLAGVLAGCAQYFGGDVLIWRLVFLCLVVVPIPLLDWTGLGGILVFLYLAFVFIAPEAEAPEDVLRMQGKNVNPQNLAEEVSRQTTTPKQSGFATLFGIIIKVFLIIICFWVIIITIAGLCGAAVFVSAPLTILTSAFDVQDGGLLFAAVKTPVYVAIGAVCIGLFIVAYCCIHAIASLTGKTRPMGFVQRIWWLAAFIIALIVLAGAVSKTIAIESDLHIERNIHYTIETDTVNSEKSDTLFLEKADSVDIEL